MIVNTLPEIRTSHGQILYGQYVRGMPDFALKEILMLARQQTTDNLSIVTTRAAARRPDDQDRQDGEHQHERDDSSDAHGAPAAETTSSEGTSDGQPATTMPTDAMDQTSTTREILPQHTWMIVIR
jgi:hypothetical protein